MADSPIGYTTRYSLAKWAEGAYAGADALNRNWDLIDAYIYSASLASGLTYSLPLRRSGNVVSIALNSNVFEVEYNALTVKLANNPYNLQIRQSGDGGLDTIQDITTTSSPTFANVTATNDITAGNYLISDLLSVASQGTLGSLIVQGSSYFNTYANILTNGNTKFGNPTSSMFISGTIAHTGNFRQHGSSSLSNNFSSGWTGTGWRIDNDLSGKDAYAELDNLTVRGTMRVYELLINQIRATNGTLIVTSAAKVSSSVDIGGDSFQIEFEDPSDNGTCPFAEGDILICQEFNLTSGSVDVIKRIVRLVANVSGPVCILVPDGDLPVDPSVPEPGDVFVRIGNTTNAARQGVLYLTSDENFSPYMDVLNGVDSWAAWTDKPKLKLRIGNLQGIETDNFGTLQDYGMYAQGGVYLESSGSANTLAMKVDSGSAIFNMKQNGNTVFDFNTATSTALIAGWTLDQYEISAGDEGAQYNKLILHASASEAYVVASQYGSSDSPFDGAYVVMGKIPAGTQWLGQTGIVGRDTAANKTYFVLTDTSQSIAGWKFDNQKFYTGDAGLGISLSTYANPYITGSGFEVYSAVNPKLFIGKKDGYFLDWNITTPNALTISGSIIGSEITAGIITGAWIRTSATGQRVEINSASLNNIKWVTSTGKTFSMTPADQGTVPGLNMGTAFFNFANATTGQTANVDYATISMYSASKSTIVRAEYTSYTGGGKAFITYATASSVSLTKGTITAGNLASASVVDNKVLTIREEGGVPGFDFTMTFPVPNAAHPPIAFYALGRYEGSSAHEVEVRVWNQTTGVYDDIGHIFNARSAGYDEAYWFPMTKGSDYVSASVVKMQFYHEASGITSHYAYIDYVGIAYHPYVRVDSDSTA